MQRPGVPSWYTETQHAFAHSDLHKREMTVSWEQDFPTHIEPGLINTWFSGAVVTPSVCKGLIEDVLLHKTVEPLVPLNSSRVDGAVVEKKRQPCCFQ